jgi:hypothetical protein
MNNNNKGKRRFYVLNEDVLKWYVNDHPKTSSKGRIHLAAASISPVDQVNLTSRATKQIADFSKTSFLLVEEDGRSDSLTAESPQEQQVWIQWISHAIQIANQNIQAVSSQSNNQILSIERKKMKLTYR